MISSLLVMNSSYVGSHDLWWTDDPEATKGYNIYRAFDYPTNWCLLNTEPWLGHFYRDQASLEQVIFTVTDADWLEKGELGRWGIRLPDIPYSDVVTGRPVLASSPDDVTVTIDAVDYRPAMVVAFDQSVWLQADRSLPNDGGVSAFPVLPDMSAIGTVTVTYNRLLNFVDIYSNLNRAFYSVVPVGDNGELHRVGCPGSQVVNTMEVDKMTWEFQAMVQRNQWLFEQVGEPAYLLFRKTRGKVCGCSGSETGLQQARTACPKCFGVGIVGGYYGPYDFLYVPPDSAITRELDEGGVKATRESRSYLGPTPIVQDGDLVVRRNGDRLVISNVIYKSPRGVLTQQDFTTSLLTPGDTRYLIPLNTDLPTIYNPVVRVNPLDGGQGNGEPIADPRTIPGKAIWENDQIPIGRTSAFSRIQT